MSLSPLKYRLMRMPVITRKMFFGCFFTLTLAVPQISCAEPAWVLVDTGASTVKIMEGGSVVAEYANISIGKSGAATLHLRGDETTPLGQYKIMAIHRDSRFGLFFGLNYPTADHAALALTQKKLSLPGYKRIAKAESNGITPPIDTVLGGAIGIHGVGGGSLLVHNQFNWTNGCVALNNDQIVDFDTRVDIGTRVVIQ